MTFVHSNVCSSANTASFLRKVSDRHLGRIFLRSISHSSPQAAEILLWESLLRLWMPVSSSASGIRLVCRPTFSSAAAPVTPISSNSLSVQPSTIVFSTLAEPVATSPLSWVLSETSAINSKRCCPLRVLRWFFTSRSRALGLRRSRLATQDSSVRKGTMAVTGGGAKTRSAAAGVVGVSRAGASGVGAS